MALASASTTLLPSCSPAHRPFHPLGRRDRHQRAAVQCQAGWQEGGEAGGWRQRAAAAAAAALLTVQGLALPAGSLAAASPVPSVAAELLQQQAVPAQQTPDALALPPLPSSFPPLPPLALPKYKQLTLSNGLRVFLLEDHELPVVRGELLFGEVVLGTQAGLCWVFHRCIVSGLGHAAAGLAACSDGSKGILVQPC